MVACKTLHNHFPCCLSCNYCVIGTQSCPFICLLSVFALSKMSELNSFDRNYMACNAWTSVRFLVIGTHFNRS